MYRVLVVDDEKIESEGIKFLRRFLYFRYTTCYTVRASLPIHASSNGDYRQLLHGAVPLGTETPE